MTTNTPLRAFMERHYRHYNAGVVVKAAKAYEQTLAGGTPMFMTLAGAMSTAQLGRSLAEMIRQGKVHAISCTGANLEEDVFNLVAHDHYKPIHDWRALSEADEVALDEGGYPRVTDICIPEEQAMQKIEGHLLNRWKAANHAGGRALPHQYLYDLLRSGDLKHEYQIDPKDSWMLAAAERDLPLFVPGWEDSTLGNMFVANADKHGYSLDSVLGGTSYMASLLEWYLGITKGKDKGPGFFQIGGGIAGDFPICVVPTINHDLYRDDADEAKRVPRWSYFCQVSDATTSYGGYSGAVPNEKITWGKLGAGEPKFMIESDATIVAPLIFGWVLGW
ncbi:MAG: deoxyhypusine synthase family protein [Phycisphaerales bacterium]